MLQNFMMDEQIQNHSCVNKAGVLDKGPMHGKVVVNPEHCHTIIKRSRNKQESVSLGCWNVGTLQGQSAELVETLNQRKIDVYCVQKVPWQGASTSTITGETSM